MADDQGDSPLSTLSNVFGFLTFTLGLLTLVVSFLSITHSAEREIQDIRERLQARESHIREIEYHFKKLDREALSDWEGSQSKIDFLMTLRKIKEHHHKATTALEINSKKHYWWWYDRPDVMGAVAAIETQFQHLNTIQLTFLLITTRTQQDHIDGLEASFGEVKRQLSTIKTAHLAPN